MWATILGLLTPILTNLLGWVTNPKNLIPMVLAGAMFVGGCQVGGTLTKASSYRAGYSAGYADGSSGKRRRLFPNIWRMPGPPDEPSAAAVAD